jgi:branched-chain amino acid transport system substrate-binding protein
MRAIISRTKEDPMRFWTYVLSNVVLALTSVTTVLAAEPIKIGVIVPLSGVFADHGQQYQEGIKLFMKQHGSQVGGREVVVIYKDETGPAPDLVKRLVQELVVQDKVDFIAGFDFSPNAIAAAPIITQARIPTVIMNATSLVIPSKSPYIVRVSFTQPQVVAPLAKWAAANGIKRVYTLVADYSPGYDAEGAFKTAFAAAGGTIVGSARIPLSNPEFAPFVQRVKDEKPDAVFLFEPPPGGIAFVKAYVERELGVAGIKLISTGDLVEEQTIAAVGDGAIGAITSHHYSSAHDSAANKKFVADYQEMFGKDKRPNFYAVGAYDGMKVIYDAIARMKGEVTGDAFVSVVGGTSFESPRGPVKIDPQTRDVVQNVYIRRTEKAGGILRNTEIHTDADVDDAGGN